MIHWKSPLSDVAKTVEFALVTVVTHYHVLRAGLRDPLLSDRLTAIGHGDTVTVDSVLAGTVTVTVTGNLF